MKVIELTQGHVAIVDDADFAELAQYRWRFCGGYAARWSSRINGRRHTIWMHKLILGAASDQQGDHRNGNTLDNRRSNLRFCTEVQNHQNAAPIKGKKVPLKGVYFHKNSFVARISANGRRHFLGCFRDAESAHSAYCEAATKLHGEFARLN